MKKRNYQEEPAVILLAEDDLGDQELIRRAMEECEVPTRLIAVNNGEEALDYLYHRGKFIDGKSFPSPDLVLLDLNMPKIDGRKVLKTVRGDARLKILPIVILTTSNQEEDILKSYESGVNSYITKPLNMVLFSQIIQTLEKYWFEVVKLPPK